MPTNEHDFFLRKIWFPDARRPPDLYIPFPHVLNRRWKVKGTQRIMGTQSFSRETLLTQSPCSVYRDRLTDG